MSASSAAAAAAASTSDDAPDLLPPPEKKPTPLPLLSPLSCLEALPPGVHEIIGSFVDGEDVGSLSLGNRWCLKTFVEGVTEVTINSVPDKASMPEARHPMYLAAFLRRRQRLKSLTVIFGDPDPVSAPVALAFAAGSCRQLESLHWDVDGTELVASAIAMNALPCLKVLNFYESLTVENMMAGLAAGGSPLLECLMVPMMEHEELPCVVAALESRSRHQACMPLRQFSMHQYREDEEVLNRLFACRMLASVEHLTLGGHARGWMDALVVYLEEGLKEGRPRGVKHIEFNSSSDYADGDAESLMNVLARGGAPGLEVLEGVWREEDDVVYWTPRAEWLLEKKIKGKQGACPKLPLRMHPVIEGR